MNDKILYLECYSGISGDMTVAALLDLGVDEKVLKNALQSLNLDGYSIQIGRTNKCGIDACDFNVILQNDNHSNNGHNHDHNHDHHNIHDHNHEHQDNNENNHHERDHHHDHAHNYIRNYDHNQHENSPNHDHSHHGNNQDHHNHSHIHDHNYDSHIEHVHEHTHVHRNIYDIYKIIDESAITPNAKSISKKIFDILAIAESKAHGLPVEEVHFHEVGAIDSIVDIVATAVCLDELGITEVVVSELYEGKGHVRCQHGIIPVPVPAVVNIAMNNSLSLRITDVKAEMVTPTGAAIVAAIKTREHLPESYKINKIGIGAGKKDFKKANILRAYIIEDNNQLKKKDEIWLLETNIDDCTGENLGYTMEKLFEKGARDVFYSPVFMKKNRPAYKLSVLCKEDDIKAMEDVIFNNTTSIGIRKFKIDRTILERETVVKETKYGKVRYKISKHNNEQYACPEYEDIKYICNKTGRGFKVVYNDLLLEIFPDTF